MRRVVCGIGVLLFVAACSHGGGSMEHASTQENFGVQMARMNLWREAMFRFRRAVQINPSSALAHNNLAVAYEANGDVEGALKEYREALRLDRSNQYIQKNYSRFVELTSRNKKRQQRQEPKTSAPAAPATTTTQPMPAPLAPPPNTPPPNPPQPNPPGDPS